MAKKVFKATLNTTETREYNNFTDAFLFSGDMTNVEVITLHDCWTITVYKHAVDGFRKGTMIEPIKQSVEKVDDSVMSIVEYPHTYVVTSFISELHAIAVARELVQ